MAATFSRAAAAAAPPRAFASLSSSRRFAPSSSFLGNSGRRASSSDSWIRDKAARTSLAPPPSPIHSRVCVTTGEGAFISDSRVMGKPLAAGATPTHSARAVYVPPALRKSVPVDTARADPSPSTPVRNSLASDASASADLSTPTPPVPKLPAAAALPLSASRRDLAIKVSISPATNADPSVETSSSPIACTDLVAETSPPACADLAVEASSSIASRADLAIEMPSSEASKLPTVMAATSSSRRAGSGGSSDRSHAFSSARYYAGSTFQESPDPHLLPPPPTVMKKLFPINISASPVAAELLVEEALASCTVDATLAPALCPPLTEIGRQDDVPIADRSSLSKSWVVDKLLAAGDKLLATRTAASSSRVAGSGGCAPSSAIEYYADPASSSRAAGSGDCAPSSAIEYYADPAFLKAPDPGHWSQFSSQQREAWGWMIEKPCEVKGDQACTSRKYTGVFIKSVKYTKSSV